MSPIELSWTANKKNETFFDNGHDFYALMLMLRWATSPWLRVLTSKRMETVARKALVEALCISLSLLRWSIQMFWNLKVNADFESNVEDANSCTANVDRCTMHLSFTFDVGNIVMSWYCSCFWMFHWPCVYIKASTVYVSQALRRSLRVLAAGRGLVTKVTRAVLRRSVSLAETGRLLTISCFFILIKV